MKIAEQSRWAEEYSYWNEERAPLEEQLQVIDPFAVYEYAGLKRYELPQVEKMRGRRIRKFKLHSNHWNYKNDY